MATESLARSLLVHVSDFDELHIIAERLSDEEIPKLGKPEFFRVH